MYLFKGVGGIFKRTDDHIFEKTLIIELSPIPQAYTVKYYLRMNNIIFVINITSEYYTIVLHRFSC